MIGRASRRAAASILVDTIEALHPKVPEPKEPLDGIVIH
jgi:hypothetical protein